MYLPNLISFLSKVRLTDFTCVLGACLESMHKPIKQPSEHNGEEERKVWNNGFRPLIIKESVWVSGTCWCRQACSSLVPHSTKDAPVGGPQSTEGQAGSVHQQTGAQSRRSRSRGGAGSFLWSHIIHCHCFATTNCILFSFLLYILSDTERCRLQAQT